MPDNRGMMLCDFHIHSTFSDGELTIPQIVDMYGQRAFGAIAITDHIAEEKKLIGKVAQSLKLVLTESTFPIYLEVLRAEAIRAREQYGMVVIPGFELSKNSVSNARSAHILALGVEEFMSADGSVEALTQKIREKGGVSIAAHPVHTRVKEKQTLYLWDNKERLRNCFDAWEVASGKHLFKEVMNSRLPILANSDLHRAHQIESWKSIIHSEPEPEAILDGIRNQRVSIKYYAGGRL